MRRERIFSSYHVITPGQFEVLIRDAAAIAPFGKEKLVWAISNTRDTDCWMNAIHDLAEGATLN